MNDSSIGAFTTTVTAYRCRCGHEWISRSLHTTERPRVCPMAEEPPHWTRSSTFTLSFIFCVLNANCPALPLMQPSPCVLSAPVRSQAAGRFPEPVALALAREAATATPGNAVWDRSAGSGAKKRYSASPWTPVVVWGDLQGEPQPFSQYSIFHLEV